MYNDTSAASLPSAARFSLLRRAWTFNWPLTLALLVHIVFIPLMFVAMLVDPKTITGVNGWIKPLKFAISGAIYAGTFLWLLTFVRGRRFWVQWAATITGAVLLIETPLIALQVLRGTTSHFNMSTFFDGAVFATMGISIALLAVMDLVLGILLLIQRLPDPVLAWGIRLGVLIAFAGMLVGAGMTVPTSEQLAVVRAGQPLTKAGAHSVGVADGGPGLQFLGWSTTGGDLRIGHFVGLHGMQVMPLVAFVLTRAAVRRRWNTRQRVGLVWTAGLSYLGLTLLLTWQALRGQPLLGADTVTWLMTAAWSGTTIGGAALALAAGRTRAGTARNTVTIP